MSSSSECPLLGAAFLLVRPITEACRRPASAFRRWPGVFLTNRACFFPSFSRRAQVQGFISPAVAAFARVRALLIGLSLYTAASSAEIVPPGSWRCGATSGMRRRVGLERRHVLR